ncbi:MAG TPA: CBS domain-containing protein, partial [Acidobacteriota bacterium]|nr:CBS domain-containing protein [Acidobacteriota bacterium]
FLYFSELLGRTVIGAEGRRLGKLIDLKVRLCEAFPKVVTARVRTRRRSVLSFPWPGVATFSGDAVVLKPGAESRPAPAEVPAEEMLLREELLDKQVVDTHGAKIERVNDVHLLVLDGDLRLVHVDIGKRGILRRLGLLRPVEGLTRWFFEYEFPEVLVSWKYVQPLGSDLGRADLKLNVGARGLHDLHPSELADILEDLDRANQARIFKSLDLETAADTLQEVEPRLQRSLLEGAPVEKATDLLEEMDPDEATDLLAELPEEKKAKLFLSMEKPHRQVLEELLTYDEGTAGRIMTKDFLAVREGQTIGDAIGVFRNSTHPLESVAYIFVLDPEGHPLGVVTLRHLLLADREMPVRGLMNPNLIMVRTDDDVKSVAAVMSKYKFLMIPVVDAAGVLVGVITFQDIMEEAR